MKYYHTIHTWVDSNGIEHSSDIGYKIEDLPMNKPIYGFAYKINDDTKFRRLSCLPVRGELDGYDFYPYKEGTATKRKSGSVKWYSRMYADTYTEAVEMYNELVEQRINKLKHMIEEAEKEKIFII